MNRREAIMVGLVVLASFVSGVIAHSISTSTALTTPRTSAVDIEVLYSGSGAGISQLVNLTEGFAFAPPASFVQTQSVLLTMIYTRASGSSYSAQGFAIQLNQGTASILPATVAFSQPAAKPTSGTVAMTPASLRVGPNLLTIALSPTCDCISDVNFVRLTVEYTFQG